MDTERFELTDEEMMRAVHFTPNPNLEKMEKRIIKAQVSKVLSLPIPIGGGVCPECEGKGGWDTRPDDPEPPTMCLECAGTGYLPVKTMTIKEIIEEALRR